MPPSVEMLEPRQHEWMTSMVGHGELQCIHCLMTNREARVLGQYCPASSWPTRSATGRRVMEKFVVVWTDSQNDVLGEETIVAQSLLALLQSLSCRVSLPEDAMGLIVDLTRLDGNGG